MEVNNVWLGWGLGDNSKSDFTVQKFKEFAKRMYASYCSDLDDTNLFDQSMQDHVSEIQTRLANDNHLVWGEFILGVLDLPTEYATGFKSKVIPWLISVEGHQSNMWTGPCADTATQLSGEQDNKGNARGRHQPTGYKNGDIPFNNADGVEALRANIANAIAAGADIYLLGYSQSMIVIYDYLKKYGIPPKLKGILAYGNPCRKLASIADWAKSWVTRLNLHGLDPYNRFGLAGCPDPEAQGIPFADVYREYDIFAQNGDDEEGKMKAAVYQAVARSDLFSNPYSLGSLVLSLFTSFTLEYIVTFIFNIMMASGSGIEFLADDPNPHYSPYDITGGKDWLRNLLIANAA